MPNKKSTIDAVYDLTDDASSGDVKALYDEWAEVYDADLVEGQRYAMPARAAAALAVHLGDRVARVLDVGCGTGLSGKALADEGFQNIDGCDLSTGMLAKAAKQNVYGRLFEADLTQPPLDAADASYDAATVVSAFGFGHIPADAMDDVLRVVKPGGIFLITVNDHYYAEGTVEAKLAQLQDDGTVQMLFKEHGKHIEEKNVGGWVFVMRKI